jgi:hypothetical protein
MVMTARVDGKRRYLTVYSCVAANAIITLAAAAAKQQKGKRGFKTSFSLCRRKFSQIE